MQNQGKTALGLDANVGSLLCYLPICLVSLVYSIIVIVTDKDNKAVRFHAFQSLLITVIYVVGIIGVAVVGGVLVAATNSGILGLLVSLLYFGFIVVFIVAMVIGCIKGYQGSSYKLPIIGDLAEKWA